MDKQLDNALAELISKVTSGAEGVIDFSKEQVPEVITQLLIWEGVSHGLFWLFGLCLMSYSVHFLVLLWQAATGEINDKAEKMRLAYFWRDELNAYGGLILTGMIMFLFLGGILFLANFDWLKVLLAPKLYLLEYGAKLLSGGA